MEQEVFTLGRSERCDYVVPSRTVSAVHCELRVGPEGRLELVDLESTNGSYLLRDGTVVPVEGEEVTIRDVVLLGTTEIPIRDVLNRLVPDYVPPPERTSEQTLVIDPGFSRQGFEEQYELLDLVATGPSGETHHALAQDGQVVMVHFLPVGSAVHTTAKALRAVIPPDGRPPLEIVQVEGAPVIITPFIKGFGGLDAVGDSSSVARVAKSDPGRSPVESFPSPPEPGDVQEAPVPEAGARGEKEAPGEFTRLFMQVPASDEGRPAGAGAGEDPSVPVEPAPAEQETGEEESSEPGAVGEFTAIFGTPEPEPGPGSEPSRQSIVPDQAAPAPPPIPQLDEPVGPSRPEGPVQSPASESDSEPFEHPGRSPKPAEGGRDWGAALEGDVTAPRAPGKEKEEHEAPFPDDGPPDRGTSPSERDWIDAVREADLSPPPQASPPPPALPKESSPLPQGPSPFTRIFKQPPGPMPGAVPPPAPAPPPPAAPSAARPPQKSRPWWHFALLLATLAVVVTLVVVLVNRPSSAEGGGSGSSTQEVAPVGE